MAVRHADPQALAAQGPAVGPGHVGRGPGLVDEDEPLGIEVELGVEPGLAAASGCRDGPARWHARSFFARDRMAGEEALERAEAEGMSPLRKRRAQLLDGDVRRLRQQREDQRPCASIRPDRRSPPSGPGRTSPCLSLQRPPAADARRAHPEPRRRLPMAGPRRTAARTRVRRSNDSAFDMSAGLPSGRQAVPCGLHRSLMVLQLQPTGTSESARRERQPLAQ